MSNITTIFFDLDGTLIDTEKYYNIFWRKALEDFGYKMTYEQALEMRSLGNPFAEKLLQDWYGNEFDYKKIREYRQKIMKTFFKTNKVEKKVGAETCLKHLFQNNYKIVLVTSATEERGKKELSKVGLDCYFSRIVSVATVKEGKPSPDVYLLACEKMKMKPEECLAVEDAPNGIISATKAGIKTVMVPDLSEPDEELSKLLYANIPTLINLMDVLL